MNQEHEIQLIGFDVNDMPGMNYRNMLALTNPNQLLYYHTVKRNRCNNDYGNVLATHLSDKGRRDLYDTAAHYANDGMITAAIFSGGTAIDIEIKMNELLTDQLKLQGNKISEGGIVVINEKGGYHWRDLEDITIIDKITLTNEEVIQFINRTYKKKPVINSLENEFYFVIDNKGKIYFDTCVYRHDTICNTHNIDCDTVIKMMYYSKSTTKHRLFQEFGIKGLRVSVVYDTAQEPFPIKTTHLNAIEKFIKAIERQKENK